MKTSSQNSTWTTLRDLVRDAPLAPEQRAQLIGFLDKVNPDDIQACVEYNDRLAPPPSRIFLP